MEGLILISHSQFINPSTAYRALRQAEANSISSGEPVEISPWVMHINLSQKNKEGEGGRILITNDMIMP